MKDDLKLPGEPALPYLDFSVPIRAVCQGHPIRVVNVGRAGCWCEAGEGEIGRRLVSELTDFEPLTLWLDAIEQRARRTGLRVELPYPVSCEQRRADPDIAALTAVGPDGRWFGYDEEGDPVHDLLPVFRVITPTAEYLEEIRHAARDWDVRSFWRAVACTKA